MNHKETRETEHLSIGYLSDYSNLEVASSSSDHLEYFIHCYRSIKARNKKTIGTYNIQFYRSIKPILLFQINNIKLLLNFLPMTSKR